MKVTIINALKFQASVVSHPYCQRLVFISKLRWENGTCW